MDAERSWHAASCGLAAHRWRRRWRCGRRLAPVPSYFQGGDERGEVGSELLLEERAERHPVHAHRLQVLQRPGGRALARVGDHVDRSGERVEQALERLGVGRADGVGAAGAGLLAREQAGDRLGDRVLELVLLDEGVGAGVDDHVDAGGVGGLPQAADVVGVLGDRAQPAALGVHGVLDVEADGAGLEQPLDQLGRRGAVAGLHVGGHRARRARPSRSGVRRRGRRRASCPRCRPGRASRRAGGCRC